MSSDEGDAFLLQFLMAAMGVRDPGILCGSRPQFPILQTSYYMAEVFLRVLKLELLKRDALLSLTIVFHELQTVGILSLG